MSILDYVFGSLISVLVFVFYGFILVHIILAIRTSLRLLREVTNDRVYMCLIVTWIVPIFGSIAVKKVENQKEIN